MGRGGGMSCTDSWSFQCAEPHSSFPSRGARSLHGPHEYVSFWVDSRGHATPLSICPPTPSGIHGRLHRLLPGSHRSTQERAEKRFPRGSKGQAFPLGREFGLGLPRKGGGLQVGCTAPSQEREQHQAGPQRVATVTAIIVH